MAEQFIPHRSTGMPPIRSKPRRSTRPPTLVDHLNRYFRRRLSNNPVIPTVDSIMVLTWAWSDLSSRLVA